MPLITIWPPPRLTRPTLDSPLVTNVPPGVVSALAWPLVALLLLLPFDVVAFAFLLVASSVARVDDVSSDRPSAGGGSDADAEASDRDDAGADERCDGNGAGGVVTVGVGLTGRGVVTVAIGVVTVAAGGVTLGFGTVTPVFGSVTVPAGVETGGTALRRPRRPPHVAFHGASACRSFRSNPFGIAIFGALGPFIGLDASAASAAARYFPASAVAYGPP